MKGIERNQPCPCGSGRKTKHCPGPHLTDIEAAYRENSERDFARSLEGRLARRRNRDRLTVLALASLAMLPSVSVRR